MESENHLIPHTWWLVRNFVSTGAARLIAVRTFLLLETGFLQQDIVDIFPILPK